MRRRSFFLLEVLIGAMLVGGFAYLSIHGAFRVTYQQKKLLKEIEDSIETDRNRMNAIAESWNEVDTLVGITKHIHGFDVTSKQIDKGKYYLLELKEKKSTKPFCYFVTLTQSGK